MAKAREKLLSPVRPNIGVQEAYRAALDDLIRRMNASLEYWLRASYRANEPEIAQDASPARELNARMTQLAAKWQKTFNDAAPDIAKTFAGASMSHADRAMQAAVRKAGMSVKFKMTATANDALQAVIAENVGLIRSIASEHLTDVQGILMRAVSGGHDLGVMSKELQDRYGVTKRRASLISRDQNAKANAVITRVRQQDLGVTEALWVHSAAGRHPRPSHVAADGKKYDIAKGMYIDGEWIRPGELINCRCISRSIFKALG